MRIVCCLGAALVGLAGCGGDNKPAETPATDPTSNAAAASTPAPTTSVSPLPPAASEAKMVFFGKKAPAAGAKWTDKFVSEGKNDKRTEERRLEVVASDGQTIQKAKVTLVTFEMVLNSKPATPNKGQTGRPWGVEMKDGKLAVTDDATSKPAGPVPLFIVTRRGPRIGQPLPALVALSDRSPKVGDVLEGEKLADLVDEVADWKDETVPMPPSVKREVQEAKLTLKSTETDAKLGEMAVFDVSVKEKLIFDADGKSFIEHAITGPLTIRSSTAMPAKASFTVTGRVKVDMAMGGKKVVLDEPINNTLTFARSWE